MPKVKIKRLGARHDRKNIGQVGETVEVSERLAGAMVRYGLADLADESDVVDPEPEGDENADESADEDAGEGEPEADAATKDATKPADKRETAADALAAKRETRANKSK